MRNIFRILGLFGLVSITLISAQAKCYRIIDPAAYTVDDAKFTVSEMSWPPDYYIFCYINEYEDKICPTCPTTPGENFDPTDLNAMNNLFSQADNVIENTGNHTGSVNAVYWVNGESTPRSYIVHWTLNSSGLIEMIFERIV